MRRLKVAQYAGEYYLLTGWIVDDLIEKRMWISNVGRSPAVILHNVKPIQVLTYAPDGQLIDVSATWSRKEALEIARRMTKLFYADNKTIVTKSSEEFRQWLDL
jgi:hypothetical protein